MIERDEALEDARREHEYAQAELRRGSSVPFPKDGKIARFFKGMDQSRDRGGAYVFYVDRTTGLEVMGYDGADPANTNAAYGARADGEYLSAKGYNISEMIDPSQAVISDDQLRALNLPSDDDWLDDDYDDYDDGRD